MKDAPSRYKDPLPFPPPCVCICESRNNEGWGGKAGEEIAHERTLFTKQPFVYSHR